MYPLDCREWETRTEDRKTFPLLKKEFVTAERRLRANRGMGVPQGLANNLEDLQRALEGLTEATAQEREDNAAERSHNEVLQAAVNALQVQMASVGHGGPEVNAMQMQQPQHAQLQANQKMGQHQNRNMSGPPAAPVQQCKAPQVAPTQQWQAQQPNPQQWAQYQQQGEFQQSNNRRFQQTGHGRGRKNVAGPNKMVQYQPGGHKTGSQQTKRPQQKQNSMGIHRADINRNHKVCNTGTNALYPPTSHTIGSTLSAQHNSMKCMNCAPGHKTNSP